MKTYLNQPSLSLLDFESVKGVVGYNEKQLNKLSEHVEETLKEF